MAARRAKLQDTGLADLIVAAVAVAAVTPAPPPPAAPPPASLVVDVVLVLIPLGRAELLLPQSLFLSLSLSPLRTTFALLLLLPLCVSPHPRARTTDRSHNRERCTTPFSLSLSLILSAERRNLCTRSFTPFAHSYTRILQERVCVMGAHDARENTHACACCLYIALQPESGRGFSFFLPEHRRTHIHSPPLPIYIHVLGALVCVRVSLFSSPALYPRTRTLRRLLLASFLPRTAARGCCCSRGSWPRVCRRRAGMYSVTPRTQTHGETHTTTTTTAAAATPRTRNRDESWFRHTWGKRDTRPS